MSPVRMDNCNKKAKILTKDVDEASNNASSLSGPSSSHMKSNMDGVYAARRVRKGSVVLTEAELPDCSLPR